MDCTFSAKVKAKERRTASIHTSLAKETMTISVVVAVINVVVGSDSYSGGSDNYSGG